MEGFWADTGELTAAAADERRGGAESAIIGFVDVHLLASVIHPRIPLWSTDNRLRDVAIELGIVRLSYDVNQDTGGLKEQAQ